MPDNQMQLLINWLDYSNDSCQIDQFAQLIFLYLFLTFLFFLWRGKGAYRGQRIMCSSFPPPCGSHAEPSHSPLFVLFFLLSPTPRCLPSKFCFPNRRPKLPIKHSKENNIMRIGVLWKGAWKLHKNELNSKLVSDSRHGLKTSNSQSLGGCVIDVLPDKTKHSTYPESLD